MAVWALFWVGGLPHYYKQYGDVALGIGSVAITAAMAVVGVWVMARLRPERRVRYAAWISFYYSVPFLLLDALYCGLYLGHGWAFLWHYWYLSIFYPLVWLLFVPMAYLMRHLPSVVHKK